MPEEITDSQILENLKQAMIDILQTGEAYTIIGSRSHRFTSAEKLQELIDHYESRSIQTDSGMSGRNYVRTCQ